MVILFDLDGTLIDSTEAVYDGFCTAFSALNHSLPKLESVTALIGLPLDIMADELGIPEEKTEAFLQHYKQRYRAIAQEKTVLLPEANEAIMLAASHARLGVVTTKTARYSKELLEYFGVLRHFDVVIGREDVVNPKPHPEPILLALQKMNQAPSPEVWMIGDTCLDIRSAKQAGTSFVGLTSGYGTEESLRDCAGDWLHCHALEAVQRIVT